MKIASKLLCSLINIKKTIQLRMWSRKKKEIQGLYVDFQDFEFVVKMLFWVVMVLFWSDCVIDDFFDLLPW